LAKKYSKYAVFIVVEADHEEFEPLATSYNITALPTFHVFENQKLVQDLLGANATALEKLVKEYVQHE
jgi:thioredoxin-like negative regulator of GroEL